MDALITVVVVESAALAAVGGKAFFGRKIRQEVEAMKMEVSKAKAIAASAYAKALQGEKAKVQDAEHKVCDFCGLVVARFKTICANCEVK